MFENNEMLLPSDVADSLIEDLECLYVNAWISQTGRTKPPIPQYVLANAEMYAKIKFLETLGALETNGFKWCIVGG